VASRGRTAPAHRPAGPLGTVPREHASASGDEGLVANERRRIAATVVATLLVTAALVGVLRGVERRDRAAQLDAAADALASGVGRELDRIAELGTAVAVALTRIDDVDVDGDAYAQLLRELRVEARYPSLLGASYVVAVPRERLDEVVAARTALDGRFRLRSDAGGPELRLILDAYPRSRNAIAIGVDVMTLPPSVDASDRSRASGSPALSNVTQLVQLPPGEPGAVLYVPIVEGAGVDRWLGLTFAGEVLLDQLLPLPADVGVRVVDPDSADFDALGSVGRAARGAATLRVPVERFGQRWEVVVAPGPTFEVPWARRASTFAGLAGLAAALLLSLLVHTLSSRERRARAIAAQRTQELATANADLAALNVALQDANAGKDAFLAAVSHELRTPLTVIGGFSDSLRRMRDDPELAVFLDPIDRNVRRLDGLVSDLLTLASLDAGAIEVFAEPVELSELARSAPRELLGPAGDAVSVTAEDGVTVRADRRHVERILTNLLSNAVRHGSPPVELTVARDDRQAVLAVRDHGAGIDEHVVPLLFRRFVRGARTEQVAGTGLGLAIVRELAELNGGEVRYVDGAPGARFEVRLPLDDDAGG
jgi:signal transduction histidine kinase